MAAYRLAWPRATHRAKMDANLEHSWRRQGLLYPTMLIAAIAVIIFSMVGIAAMTGLLPSAMSGYRAPDEPSPAIRRQPQDSPRALDTPRASSHPARDIPRASSQPAAGAARAAPAARKAAVCRECGVVESVRTVERKGEGSFLGAGAGAVIGGLLGNQVGAGHGRAVATVAGASAGAFAGNEIERNMNSRIIYQVRVRMNDGSHRNHYQATEPRIGVGQRVRLADGRLIPD